ncbi:hypothetical protein [Biostraticola tofi]|uniref:Uncharacterized protein n=1 Tax=Biostraticola tofi TaxID=466109 RepID=A0A4R3Z8K2_9GAMM|nr:hypothetical protein [Biostraticola tofi]TCW00410.1 hypothetical protein EDC52_101760 [Biostraticola tofi]
MMNKKTDNFMSLVYVARKSDIRRVWGRGWKTIDSGQRNWTRYMLALWGSKNAGDDSPRGCINIIGRLMIRTKWNSAQGGRILEVVDRLHKEGYRGNELFQKARDIVIPNSSASNIIALAKESDDAAFVEGVITKAFHRDSPIRLIAIKRYCDRKDTQGVAKDLVWLTGCDIQLARKRIAWCETLLEEVMYYSIRREMEKEYSDNNSNIENNFVNSCKAKNESVYFALCSGA